MLIAHDSPITYTGPGLIDADDTGADHTSLADYYADLVAAGYDQWLATRLYLRSRLVGGIVTARDSVFINDVTASYDGTYQLAAHNVLKFSLVWPNTDAFISPEYTLSLDGFGTLDPATAIWARLMVRMSPTANFPATAGAERGCILFGPNFSRPFSSTSDPCNLGFDMQTREWTLWWSNSATVLGTWPGSNVDAAIALFKAGWTSIVMLADARDHSLRLWINGVFIGAMVWAEAEEWDFYFTDPLGMCGFAMGDGNPSDTYAPTGDGYLGLWEFINGSVEDGGVADPYGLLASDCATGWRATFFADDDLTPLLGEGDGVGGVFVADFHTSAGCPRPYLQWPTDISETEVNFQDGRSVIGAMTLGILDKRTVSGDQTTGIMTALLEQLRDARCLVECYYDGAWQVVMDGVVQGVALNRNLVRWDISLRDLRERERDFGLFAVNETWSLYPERGAASGYGYPAGAGDPLLPAASVLDGTYTQVTSGARRQGYVQAAGYVEALPAETLALGEPVIDTSGYVPVAKYPQVTVRWRPNGGAADSWKYLRDATMPAILGAGNLFAAGVTGILNPGSLGVPVGYVPTSHPVQVLLEGDTADMPTPGQAVEVQVLSRVVSEATPFVWEGSFGTLLRQIYDGDYSTTPPRVRYDFARFDELELTTPTARLWLEEPVEDMRRWVEENIYKVLGMAPVVDERGRVNPIAYEVPATGTVLPVLDDDSVHVDAQWEAGLEGEVSEVEFVYQRDYRVPIVTATEVQQKKGLLGIDFLRRDKTVTIENTTYEVGHREVRQIYASIGGTKGRTLKYEPDTVRVLGTIAGQPLSGDTMDETGAQLAAARAHDAMRRWSNISPRITLRARQGDAVAAALKVGDWCNVVLSWLPDPATGLRGCDRIMQVLARRPPQADGWVRLSLIDGGPRLATITANLTVSPAPAFDAAGLPTVVVTVVPATYTGRIDMAISTLAPAADSPLWLPIALGLTAAGTYQPSYPVPVDAFVWVRWRVERTGEQPGPWSTPVQVGAGGTTTNTVPGLLRAGIDINFTTGTVTVTWTPNSVTGGVRVYYDLHADATVPVLTVDYVDVNAVTGTVALPAPLVPIGATPQLASVRIVPYPAYPISGTAGTEVQRSTRYPGTDELPVATGTLDTEIAALQAQIDVIEVGAGVIVDAEQNRRTSGGASISSASYVAVDTATNIVLLAKTGDVLWVGCTAYWTSSGAGSAYLDVATMSAAPAIINYVSGTGVSGLGVPGWRAAASTFHQFVGGIIYVVQAADVVAGQVTLQLIAKVTSGTRTLSGGATEPLIFSALNYGIPGDVTGAVDYKGTWNATTNVPTLASGVGTLGDWYVVAVAGTTSLDGIASWAIGDWLIFNGTVWEKVAAAATHAASHQNGGADEISVAGLSGLLADAQTPLAHALNSASHTGTLAYAQLPTGNGTWDTGVGTAITIARDFTVSGISTLTGDVITQVIRRGTADGADNSYLGLGGGGALGSDRGANIVLYGNEEASTGLLSLQAGNVVGGIIKFQTAALQRGSVTYAGVFAWVGAATIGTSLTIGTTLTIGTSLAVTGISTLTGDVKIAALSKLYLDGGGDTYIAETSVDFISIFAGAVNVAAFNTGTPADGDSNMYIRTNHGGTTALRIIKVGAADSDGAGFRSMRLAN